MSMKSLATLLISFIILFSACKKHDSNGFNPEYFQFGNGGGFCLNCNHYYLIENGKLYADSMCTTTFLSTPMSNDKYILAKTLVNDFPKYLLDNPNQTYGCPNCHDQGKVYIECKINGTVEKWNIDPDTANQPSAIKSYIQQMNTVIEQLR